MVLAAAGYRMPEDEIALVIINPQTKAPISPVTLRKHFAEEIAKGYATLKMRIMAATVRNALGVVKQGPNGEAIVESQGNVTAQIWLQKTLYGARELTEVIPPTIPLADGEASVSDIDAARRVAFLMASGARAMQASQAVKAKPAPKPKKAA